MLNIFNRKIKNVLKVINENVSYSSWDGDAYSNDIFRGAVDAIARNSAKLRACHVILGDQGNEALNRALQIKPNRYMTAFDFLYKVVSQLYTYSNAWVLIDRSIPAFYPITPLSVQMLTDTSDTLFVKFMLSGGQEAVFKYSDLIHLRRFFNSDVLLGSDNKAIKSAIELANAENETITAGLKSCANLRGILRYTQLLNDDDLKQYKSNFVNDYLNISNEGGVVAVDSKAEYTPITSTPIILNAEQSKAIREKIYSYLGICESIVNSSYDENAFSAFYESTISPLAIALSLEFTSKFFTDEELRQGNEIIFEANRLQFVSNKTKVDLIKELMPLGVLTTNQALDVLNLPRVKDGDRRIQSLNYVQSDKILDYQLKGQLKGDEINGE